MMADESRIYVLDSNLFVMMFILNHFILVDLIRKNINYYKLVKKNIFKISLKLKIMCT